MARIDERPACPECGLPMELRLQDLRWICRVDGEQALAEAVEGQLELES